MSLYPSMLWAGGAITDPDGAEALSRLVRGEDGTYRGKATGNTSGPLSYEVELRPVP